MPDKPTDNRQPVKFLPEQLKTMKNLADEIALERGVTHITYRDLIMEAIKFYSDNRKNENG